MIIVDIYTTRSSVLNFILNPYLKGSSLFIMLCQLVHCLCYTIPWIKPFHGQTYYYFNNVNIHFPLSVVTESVEIACIIHRPKSIINIMHIETAALFPISSFNLAKQNITLFILFCIIIPNFIQSNDRKKPTDYFNN